MKIAIIKRFSFISIVALTFNLSVGGVSAQQTVSPPTYTRDVVPILQQYCIACHNDFVLKGGLSMERYESLMSGGDEGEVIVPGKSSESRLVLMVEGELEPKMPLLGDSPTAAEIEIIKAWIDAGAKPDVDISEVKVKEGEPKQTESSLNVPDIRPKLPVKGQISSVAYSPDGTLLATGSYREVMLIEVATGKMVANLKEHAGAVNAVAFSPDGKMLCAGGGSPQQFGEIKIWEVETRTSIETLRAHRDAIYSIAFSPDGKKLAAASYDRLVSLWEIPAEKTGVWPKEPRMLKDHTDAVYSVAFSPDGKLMASASGDRTVKVWDVASGQRLYTLSEATAELYSVAFHPSGAQLAAA
ncbi:PD40 domain-containing protein, partial [Candidatus Poribacteria bacterium]|nr:PD40 domain-containing protein [Candidatus Poribacteria bacterium]